MEVSGCCPPCSVLPTKDISDSEEFNLRPKLEKVLKLRGLKILHHNMQSLRRKMDNLRVLFRKPNYRAHLLALTATWAKEVITDKEFEIPGYTLFRKDRGNKGGGIAIHARDD